MKRRFEELLPDYGLAASLIKPFVTDDGYYRHHGIFINDHIDRLAVIDFSGQTEADAKPRLRPILEFLGGCSDQDLFRVVYEDPSECYLVNDTVRKAREIVRLGEIWPAYHVFRNNCETFATVLKTGKAVSTQAIRALQGIVGIGYGLGFGIGGSLGQSTDAARIGGTIGGAIGGSIGHAYAHL